MQSLVKPNGVAVVAMEGAEAPVIVGDKEVRQQAAELRAQERHELVRKADARADESAKRAEVKHCRWQLQLVRERNRKLKDALASEDPQSEIEDLIVAEGGEAEVTAAYRTLTQAREQASRLLKEWGR